jgi:NhaA family Na+:H+ antiporter
MTTHALPHRIAFPPRHVSARTAVQYTLDHFLLLPLGGLIALIWANLRPESYFATAHALAFVVNEIGMALFFALIAQEVVEEVMPGGALHTWRRWTLPVVGAAGALLGSAVVYLAYVNWRHQLFLTSGWPIAGAVDLAFAYFIVKVIFGRHPAIPFLLLLAIAANAAGILAIASRQSFVEVRPGGTALMLAALGVAFALRRWKVRTFWPYLVVCGPLSWWGLYFDGFHPALALVPIVPFMPHAPRSLELFADAPHGRHDSRRHFEHVWTYPIQAVLFMFGLVNAGVLLSGYGAGTWALLYAAIIGKPLGILAAVGIALAFGLHLPSRLHWRDLIVVALATSGGFTFGLFFATAVFPLGSVLTEVKMGAVATGLGVLLAFGAARLLHVGRFGPEVQPHGSHAEHRGHVHHAPRSRHAHAEQ